MCEPQENFWFSLDFPLFSSIFHYLCKVCEKKLKIFLEKLKDFGEKTQRIGSKSLHLAPKKVVNKKAWSTAYLCTLVTAMLLKWVTEITLLYIEKWI